MVFLGGGPQGFTLEEMAIACGIVRGDGSTLSMSDAKEARPCPASEQIREQEGSGRVVVGGLVGGTWSGVRTDGHPTATLPPP